jgi:hypothetical protein
MTGSSLAPIIIPIVVTPALAIWLAMVYYAGRHPMWRARQAAVTQQAAGPRLQPSTRAPQLSTPGRPATLTGPRATAA